MGASTEAVPEPKLSKDNMSSNGPRQSSSRTAPKRSRMNEPAENQGPLEEKQQDDTNLVLWTKMFTMEKAKPTSTAVRRLVESSPGPSERTRSRTRNLSEASSSCSSNTTGTDAASSCFSSPQGSFDVETDVDIISRREKQIEYGKTTSAYAKYLKDVPRLERGPNHPKTPKKNRKYSRRAWDGLIKQWRLQLHTWSDLPSPDVVNPTELLGKRRRDSCSSGTNSHTESDAHSASDIMDVECNNDKTLTGDEGQKEEKQSFHNFSWADDVEDYDFSVHENDK